MPGPTTIASGWDARLAGTIELIRRVVLAVLLVLGCEGLARAEDGEWSVLLEPMYMDAYGHDQHVLTVRDIDLGSTPTVATETPVALDTDGALGLRFELQYARSDWGAGLDFSWFDTSQGRPSRNASGGPDNEVTFETPGRTFSSNDPDEVLFFNVLEDTELNAWTFDLYGLKTLAELPAGDVQLQFGVRNADFDNDYHSVVGVQDVAGSAFDASSNYGRMMGPLVGLVAEANFGKHSVRGYIGQSVVLGSASLTNSTRDFVGPVSAPTVVGQESFGKEEDVAIPITEFRVGWLYPISRRVSLGLSANTSVWWDVRVPPGVVPGANGNEVFLENTIVYFGLAIAVKFRSR
jgi:hypothetical protein